MAAADDLIRSRLMKIILIADDSPVIRKVGRRLMEAMGFVVAEALDGTEAIKFCRENMPDAAIIDWDMPGRSGIDVINEIAGLPSGDQIKILFCTSALLIPEMTKAKRAGAKGFLMKPFSRKLLEQKFVEIGLMEQRAGAA
jgi:two-component system, chemotaxis family, chemotaxis protein CheY